MDGTNLLLYVFLHILSFKKKDILSEKNNTRIFGQFFMFKPTTFQQPR